MMIERDVARDRASYVESSDPEAGDATDVNRDGDEFVGEQLTGKFKVTVTVSRCELALSVSARLGPPFNFKLNLKLPVRGLHRRRRWRCGQPKAGGSTYYLRPWTSRCH
jgi:hypothetical protein